MFTLLTLAWPWPRPSKYDAFTPTAARFGPRTYKMADPCILLWFIYLFSLKKRKRRKYRIKLAVHDIDARLAEFHAVFGKKPYNDKNPVWSDDLSPF